VTLADAEEFDAAIAGLDLGSSVVGHGLGITVSLDGQAGGGDSHLDERGFHGAGSQLRAAMVCG